MKRLIICSAIAAALAAPGLAATAAPAGVAPAASITTINTVTPAAERRARRAASRAGYTITGGLWAQGGYLFANATRRGSVHQLTIDPAGKVYASTSNPPAPTAPTAR